eukprot:6212432-Pleurochrysis_carterae.AAC.3
MDNAHVNLLASQRVLFELQKTNKTSYTERNLAIRLSAQEDKEADTRHMMGNIRKPLRRNRCPVQ